MEIDPSIQRIMELYYAVGIWQNNSSGCKSRKFIRVSVFLFFAISYPVAMAGGLASNDFRDNIIIFTIRVVVAVFAFKGFYIFFKQDEILSLLNSTCIQSVRHNDCLLKNTLHSLHKCCAIFVVLSTLLTLIIIILSTPLYSYKLSIYISFPLVYEIRNAAHWMTHSFVLINDLFVFLVSFISSIMWYVILNCSVQYNILGNRLKNVGMRSKLNRQIFSKAENLTQDLDNRMISQQTKNRSLFESELIECIEMHKQLEKYVYLINHLDHRNVNVIFFSEMLTVCVVSSHPY